VAGLSADAARTLLTDARLKVGRLVDAPSATVPRGMVVDSTPAAGSEVKIESAVDLTLSAGPAAAPVPKVIGKRLSKAKELLEQAGFAVGSTKYGSHDDFDSGVVIGQNPAAGAQATPGVKIDLTIND
jgi:serine/threonine-protein kinase